MQEATTETNNNFGHCCYIRRLSIVKIILALICMFFIQAPISSAFVEQRTISEINLSISYPLVYTDNAESQELINSDIANFVYDIKDRYDSGDYYSANMKYDTTYEDNNVVSIVLKTYVVRYPGAAHGMSWNSGLVYNKITGERIPLSNYVHIKSPEQIQQNLSNGVLSAYNENMTRNYFFRETVWSVKKISQNYILAGNGTIYLLYPPYSIGPYSSGTIRVKFTPTAIDYLERGYKK